MQDVGGRGAATTPQRYAYLGKIDSHLQDVAASRLGTGTPAEAAIAAQRQGVTLSAQGEALTDVYVNGDVDAAAGDLRALGMRITAVSRRAPQRMVEGYLPPEAIAEAAALGQAKAISTPFLRVHMGSALSQGDDVINGPEARALGPTGAGVAVGIISDSIDATPGGGISDSVASGDLPSDTVDLSNPPPASGTDEGRAMAEIVYDEAPGVSRIRFVTANPGPAAKAQGIDALVAAGVKVIADDTSYIAEPFFQDDVIAQAVDRAKAAGVAVFVSAGNDARNAWQGTFTPGPNDDGRFRPVGRGRHDAVGRARCPRTSSWTSCCSGPSRGDAPQPTLRSTSTTSPGARPSSSGARTRGTSRPAFPKRSCPSSRATPRRRTGS